MCFSCREAARKASLLLDTTVLDESRTPLKLPGFERVVTLAATKALESWRDEALEGTLCSAKLHLPSLIGSSSFLGAVHVYLV